MFEWLEWHWHEIKFAEKSVRVKIVLLMLVSSWLTWAITSHSYSDDIAKQNFIIQGLKEENAKLKAALPKKDDKNKTGQVNNPDSNGLADDIADKIYEIKNDINNMKSNADVHYQIYRQRVGNAIR